MNIRLQVLLQEYLQIQIVNNNLKEKQQYFVHEKRKITYRKNTKDAKLTTQMYTSAENNYRTEGAPNSGGSISGHGSSAGGPQSSNYMSVAAKAGEMQIFSSDILNQVNGLQRRQQKAFRQGGGKYSSHTNDHRLSHIQEQMNTEADKMLQIDAAAIKPNMSVQDRPTAHQMLNTIQNSSQERIQPLQTQSIGAIPPLPRDSLTGKPKLTALQNHQRLHPSQTFGEYVASNTTAATAKSRMTMNMPPNSNISSNGSNSLQVTNQLPKLNSGMSLSEQQQVPLGMNGMASINNSTTVIGGNPTSYSSKQTEVQNSPLITCHISEKHLQIEVQNSQQGRRGLPMPVEQQTFTPNMMRRSIGSRSAAKQNERISFLDKTAQQNNQITALGFDVKNAPGPQMPATTGHTAKKLQAVKEVQQQLLQSRYTNGTEPNMLPKMAGISLERKMTNQSKQKNGSLPPTGSLSMIQQNNIRRRHGESSFSTNAGSRMEFGVSGESLQIKLTGTSLMNRNQNRDSYSQHMATKDSEVSTMTIPGILNSISNQNQAPQGVYHPKMRGRMPDMNAPPTGIGLQYQHGGGAAQTQFAQHMAEIQMNSPRNSNQIFQENSMQHARVYSYHYIYDYLFVQVTEEQFEKEYAKRIRTYPSNNEIDREDTPERIPGLNSGEFDPMSPNMNTSSLPVVDNPAEVTATPLRGPTIKLNQNQVFFSPNLKENQSMMDETSRFRKSSTDNMNGDNDYNLNTIQDRLDSSDYPGNKKQVVKMGKKQFNIRCALEKALQNTQFEGLKILTKDTILKAQKSLGKEYTKNEQEFQPVVPSLKLPNSNNNSDSEQPAAELDDEAISKFMIELGSWLQEQNQRFKVTVKKKYINDILMQSKGAQNLAQNVVMVITNNAQLNMNSPNKKAKRAKRNLSVDISSGEEEQAELQHRDSSRLRNHGQATPQVTSSKAKAQQIIGRRGYESESEAKSSLNSTTASSTFPNLKGGYATKQQTPRQPRKMSTRSLSNVPNTVRVQRKDTSDINGQGAQSESRAGDDLMNQLNVRYPQTKIKIVQNVHKYNDHSDHPINKMLSDYNEFTRLVFRTRTTEARAVQSIPYAIKLGRRLGMQLTKNQLMPATLKVRENANAIKEKLIFHICRVLKQENEFEGADQQSLSIFNKQISDHTVQRVNDLNQTLAAHDGIKNQIYRCYVGKGNNQMMVRALFKNRFWWLFHEKDEPEKVNFFWTQLRKLTIMNSLTCKFVNPKDKSQQKQLNQLSVTNPNQGLGLAIAQNSALLTPSSTTKFKRRKVSSAHSKSPDQALSAKQSAASALATGAAASTAAKETTSEQSSSSQVVTSNINMALVGIKRPSDTSIAEEKKAEVAPIMPGVTFAPPENKPATSTINTSPPPVNREESKKEREPIRAAADANGRVKPFDTYPVKLANKIEDNYHLCNKKALFVNMKNYYEAIGEDPFDSLPVTFHIKEGLDDPNFLAFKQYYEEHRDANNIWITKPGECTNRGVGIQVAKEWGELQGIITESTRSTRRTCIVQKYIHNPLLIHRRKFDIRTYCMSNCINGNYKAYYYTEGYLRTSCREFSLNNLSNRMVHLTNDAVQKKAEDYGKFEPGNKLSYSEFQSYIDKNHGNLNVCFERDILPQIKKLTTDCFRATWGKMDPYKRFNTFECFGLDFMIDDLFKVYLIEVNTNPCLELSSPLLARLIPSMVENSLRLAVDPVFPPPEHFSQRKTVVNELCPENKFELIFDERIDGPELTEIFREKDNIIIEIDEEELSDADIDGKDAAE